MEINEGDLVQFRKGLYPDEEDAVYRVLEINGDRCILVLASKGLLIPPQSIAMLQELELHRDDPLK
jgi:hypothetical protein